MISSHSYCIKLRAAQHEVVKLMKGGELANKYNSDISMDVRIDSC